MDEFPCIFPYYQGISSFALGEADFRRPLEGQPHGPAPAASCVPRRVDARTHAI
jgi:hypothetical protein